MMPTSPLIAFRGLAPSHQTFSEALAYLTIVKHTFDCAQATPL